MKTYNYSWIDFLSGTNVIKVTNEKEFNTFKNFLQEYGLIGILNTETEYANWQKLATINGKNENVFLFEYNNHKGLTWGDNIKEAIEWYDKDPINVSELQDYLDKKHLNIKTTSKNSNRKKLCELVEIEENNMDCVILKVKENSEMDLIKLGCFEGDETLIRVTKGSDNTFTVFSGETYFSWYQGENGHSLISKNTDQKRILILECIEMDFDIYIGKDKEKIKQSLDILSLKDTYNKVYDIEIMYWENQKNTDVIVHKNGEFFRHFSGIEDAKNKLKNNNCELTFKGKHTAVTGCIVEEYTVKKVEKLQDKSNENGIDNDYDYE